MPGLHCSHTSSFFPPALLICPFTIKITWIYHLLSSLALCPESLASILRLLLVTLQGPVAARPLATIWQLQHSSDTQSSGYSDDTTQTRGNVRCSCQYDGDHSPGACLPYAGVSSVCGLHPPHHHWQGGLLSLYSTVQHCTALYSSASGVGGPLCTPCPPFPALSTPLIMWPPPPSALSGQWLITIQCYNCHTQLHGFYFTSSMSHVTFTII